MNKIFKIIIGIFIFILLINLFFRNEGAIKPINEKYIFCYYNEFHICYVKKKGEKRNKYIFDGKVEYFGINKNKLYCLINKDASINKNGWYSLDLTTDAIEFVKEANFDKTEFGKQYNVEIINVHSYFGYDPVVSKK